MAQQAAPTFPAGYQALIEQLGLKVIAHWHTSAVTFSNRQLTEITQGRVHETYRIRSRESLTLGQHLEFALKHDGVNLAILAAVFARIDPADLTSHILTKPTGRYARKLWCFYELITGKRLPLDDLTQGNYQDLLDSDHYFTAEPGQKLQRYRLNDNLLGDPRFCPIIRKTPALAEGLTRHIHDRCQHLTDNYSTGLLRRALSYLYTRETRSSFEIEHEKPNASRSDRFIALLQLAEDEDFCDKPRLVELQNRTVDPRFAQTDWRSTQNYVGQTIGFTQERVHYVSPRPGDVPSLMDGLIVAHQRMEAAGVHPLIHAAVIAYGFVFIHPFEDGNGRIHRFLIHNILARRGYTPDGLMFPVSAAMLHDPEAYDASLEAFSKPLLPLLEYDLDAQGRMTVEGETAAWYRYMDMTAQAEALAAFIDRTIDVELPRELDFLAKYDAATKAVQRIIDMPDRLVDLFIAVYLQNGGSVSESKQQRHFDFLTSEELQALHSALSDIYGKGGQGDHTADA